MPTQTITLAAYQTLCAEVADALAAYNFAGAYSKYAQAEAVLAALETRIGDNASYLQYRESLKTLGDAIAIAEKAYNSANEHSRFIRTRCAHG